MGRASVAVLDIRSSEVTVLVGERGVNHTFIFKASRTEGYDGYENGTFYDVKALASAIYKALSSVELVCGERVGKLYVGVPGEFVEVVPKEHDISFSKKRKITKREIDMLFESGRDEVEGYRFIRASSMIYVTSDNRRVVDPTGLVSSGLFGLLSYFYCSDYFAQTLEDIFSEKGVDLSFIPSEYAQAIYLIPSETRDEYAVFLDSGFLSSTVCVLLGGGVLAQKSVWAGTGQIAVRLMETFSLPYDAACALLSKTNLFSVGGARVQEFHHRGISYEIDYDKLLDVVREGLDAICEGVSAFLEECTGKELEYKPLYVTGEGICSIRGAAEHVGKRLDRVCEQVTPRLAYYNKPSASSRIALADVAYEDCRKRGFIYKILNAFGG